MDSYYQGSYLVLQVTVYTGILFTIACVVWILVTMLFHGYCDFLSSILLFECHQDLPSVTIYKIPADIAGFWRKVSLTVGICILKEQKF